MKRIHYFLAGSIILLSSCSAYKQAQTPDDVYYSPGAPAVPSVTQQNTPTQTQSDYYSIPNDQYVHLKAQDPERWSYFDNYNTDYYAGYPSMAYSPYSSVAFGMSYGAYGYGVSPWIGFGYWSPFSYWNSYYTWNSFYNPYYAPVVIVNPKNASYNYAVRTSTFNPASYTNNNYNRNNTRANGEAYVPSTYSQTIRSNYSNANINTFRNYNTGQSQRPSLYRSSNTTQPTRSYSAPSFGGGSVGGGRSGGGGGGIGRPGR
jgi:hypothetical protein